MFDQFVGLPWCDGGRSAAGVDCYGLLFLVFRELRGIELPSFSDRYTTEADQVARKRLIAGQLDAWDEIAPGDEAVFDGVLLRIAHIGLVVAPGLMLHIDRDATSTIERYGSGAFRHRVSGFYRFKAQ